MSHLSLKQALQWAIGVLTTQEDSACLEAELLLAHVLQKPRSYLFTYLKRP